MKTINSAYGWAAVILAFTAILSVCGISTASAQFSISPFYCESEAQGGNYPSKHTATPPCSTGDSVSYSGTVNTGVIVNDVLIFYPFTQSFDNSSQGTAQLAVLQASATATTTASPAYYDYTDSDGETARLVNPLIIGSSAGTTIASNLIAFVAGGSLPKGTLVQYRLTLKLTGGAKASPCIYDTDSQMVGTLYANVNAQTNEGAQGISIAFDGCEGMVFNTSPAVLSAVVGASFNVGAELLVGAGTYSGAPPPVLAAPFIQTATANAGGTLTFYLDPITPGATYIDSAGVVNGYASPPSTVAVPNVVGESQRAATRAIDATGLVLGTVSFQSSDSVTVGNVLTENPPAADQVAEGTVVDLVISSGVPAVLVPSVVGDTQALATTAITGAKLVVGTLSTENSASVALGAVISQSPPAGTSVTAGSTVNLSVSIGPLRGDINGDSEINSLDLALITSVLNTPANGANDPRDLNHDGVINMLDGRILITLCTHPGCAIN